MSNSTIVENLRKEIDSFSSQVRAEKVGHVVEVFDGIAKVSGLSDVKSSEMVIFPNGETGVALNLEEDTGIILPQIEEANTIRWDARREKVLCNSQHMFL